jgi:hypothetical protein
MNIKTNLTSACRISLKSLSKNVARTSMALAIGISAMATQAHAVVVNYIGTDYEVTSFFGSYNDNRTLLESQIWFGDSGIASDFAALVNTQLGLPGFGVYSPYFAFETVNNETEYTHRAWDVRIPGVGGQSQSTSSGWTFAMATAVSPVPVPAAFPLLLAALGGLGFVARRRKPA